MADHFMLTTMYVHRHTHTQRTLRNSHGPRLRHEKNGVSSRWITRSIPHAEQFLTNLHASRKSLSAIDRHTANRAQTNMPRADLDLPGLVLTTKPAPLQLLVRIGAILFFHRNSMSVVDWASPLASACCILLNDITRMPPMETAQLGA